MRRIKRSTVIAQCARPICAQPGEQGDAHFFGSGCDLRIVDPLGNVEHTRTFLNPARYTAVDHVKVLRRRDGCAFALLLPAPVDGGSRFPEADYRLTFTYRLDNTPRDPGSVIEREAGISDPEITELDVPR